MAICIEVSLQKNCIVSFFYITLDLFRQIHHKSLVFNHSTHFSVMIFEIIDIPKNVFVSFHKFLTGLSVVIPFSFTLESLTQNKLHQPPCSLFVLWSWAIFTVFRVFPICRRFVYVCLLRR